MADVWAINKKGDKRKFTQISWDLAHDGWELLPDHVIHNVANKTILEKPKTGNTKSPGAQKIENVLEKNKVSESHTEPNSNALNDAKSNNENEIDAPVEITPEQKAEFLKAANGIKTGAIKDYFEREAPTVEIKGNVKYPELLNLLGEQLKFDVVELQKAFGK